MCSRWIFNRNDIFINKGKRRSMPRKTIDQEVFYKSFRFTSNQLYLNEFLSDLQNANRFIQSLIMSSKRYKNYLHDIEEKGNIYLSGGFDDGVDL